MYNIIRLSKGNIERLKEINYRRNDFNTLNLDFFEIYEKSNFAQQIFQRRNVKLVLRGDKIVGYIWYTNIDKGKYVINSLYVDRDIVGADYPYVFKLITLNLKSKNIYIYNCEVNDYNGNMLEKLNFIKGSGTIKMVNNIDKYYSYQQCYNNNSKITFKQLEKNKDEKLRCHIQNEIFKSNERVPLTDEDIYFDEIQDYYIDDGAAFIKYMDKYIGYAQYILEDNEPIIVNFGLIDEYRGYGYSKLLLMYMLHLIQQKGYRRVFIKVDCNNVPAINLYKTMKFIVLSENYNYILKK